MLAPPSARPPGLPRLRSESGAGMVSLLATVAAVALLVALAVPALKSGSNDQAASTQPAAASAAAQDAQAKVLLQTAQTAMQTYAATSSDGFSGATVDTLHSLEPTLISSSTTGAYIASVSATSSSYTVVAVDPLSRDTFTLADTGGTVAHTCTPAGQGGCSSSGTW